jgi:tRNA (guanine-N7-)-methyltransferase
MAAAAAPGDAGARDAAAPAAADQHHRATMAAAPTPDAGAVPVTANQHNKTNNSHKRKKGGGLAAAPAADRPPPRQDPEAMRTVADNRGSPFFELGLAISAAGQGRTRVRQHVNPLRAEFSAPPPAPDWRQLFTDPTRPLVVDVGCGQGRFLLLLARRMHELRARQEEAAAAAAAGGDDGGAQSAAAPPSPAVLLPLLVDQQVPSTTTTTPPINYLGIEIREPLVERANRWAETLDMRGEVAFCFANATAALPRGFLDGYPGPLAACLVQFPDPHFKRRHHKRRVLQPELARFLRDRVAPGGCVFLQSDIHSAAAAMRDAVEEFGGGPASFELAPQHFAGGGATFPDAGPPPAQVSAAGVGGGPPTQSKKRKQKKGQDEEGDDGDGNDDKDDDGDDGQSGPAPTTAFVSQWSREGGWLSVNPIGVPTEREHYVTAAGGSIFRVLLRRKRDDAQAKKGGSD